MPAAAISSDWTRNDGLPFILTTAGQPGCAQRGRLMVRSDSYLQTAERSPPAGRSASDLGTTAADKLIACVTGRWIHRTDSIHLPPSNPASPHRPTYQEPVCGILGPAERGVAGNPSQESVPAGCLILGGDLRQILSCRSKCVTNGLTIAITSRS